MSSDASSGESAPTSLISSQNAPQNAALTGALLAFSKLRSNDNVVNRLHNGVDASQAAAIAKSVNAAVSSTLVSTSTLRPAYTGSSTTSHFGLGTENTSFGNQVLTPDWSSVAALRARTPQLETTSSHPTIDARTASLRAATIATARATPSRTSSNESAPKDLSARDLALQRRLKERAFARSIDGSMDEVGNKTDSTSIEPTKSLVKLYEQNASASSRPGVTRHVSLAKGKPPPILAPKPQRTLSVASVSPELRRPDLPTKPKPLLPEKPIEDGKPPAKDRRATSKEPTTTVKPDLPAPRRTAKKPAADSSNGAITSEPPPQLSRFGLPMPSSTKGTPRPPSRASFSYVLPSNANRPSPAPYKDESLNMISPHMTGDSLANAMVGAHLALSTPPPSRRSRTPPPVPGPRRKHHYGIDMLPGSRTRSLSPQKKTPGKMMTTLRGDEVEEKMKNRKHHFRQPNKHHEGTRERWRDFVSEAERKRYEGLWAANKGLYISSPEQADEVLNLVVKDIWLRSRLPQEKLGRVWDLVATDEEAGANGSESKRRTLTREQFVVGLWLIDQVLKGRNLPHNVNASVWSSVRLMGVKVRLEGKGKDGRKLERGTAW